MAGDMFEPRECAKGALLVWVITAVWFGSWKAGLLFAVVPLGFGIMGLVSAARERIGR